MSGLFKIEWQRVRLLTGWATALHMILLLLLVNLGQLFGHSVGLKISLATLYGAFGLLFAVLQIKLYKTDGQWIYLLNRPLSRQRVFLNLLGAALLCFTVVLVLPWLLITIAMDHWAAVTVDGRYYLQLLYFFGLSVSSYLVGYFLVLSQSRWSAVVLILPILTLMSINLGGRVFILQAMVIGLLLPMVLAVFKINIQQPPQGHTRVWVLALVIQWCAFMFFQALISLVYLSVEEFQQPISLNTHEQPITHPHVFSQVAYLDSKDKIMAGLSDLPADSFEDWRINTTLNEAFRIRKRVWFHPSRHQLQLMDERPLQLNDERNKIQWQFSHDAMLFIGHHVETLSEVGYLGPAKVASSASEFSSAERFKSVPWITGHQFIVDNQLFQYDPVTLSIHLVFTAPLNEYLLNGMRRQGSISSLVSTQQLHIFDEVDWDQANFPLQPVLSLPLPDDYNNLWDITVMETRDQFLLSMLYGKDPRKDVYSAFQHTLAFDFSGNFETIAVRPLPHNGGIIINHLDYAVSPLWTVVTDRWPALPARDRYLQERPWPAHLPITVWLMVGVMALVGFFITFRWARKRSLSPGQTWLWSLTNMITGLPGLISFKVVHHSHGKHTIHADLKSHDQPSEVLRHV